MKKLMVTDIDGTITTRTKSLESEVCAAIHRLYESNWDLFFITGRFFAYAREILSDIKVPYLLGCQNGASVWSSKESRIILSNTIENSYLSLIESIIDSHPVVFTVGSGAERHDKYYRKRSVGSVSEFAKIVERTYFSEEEARKNLFEVESLSEEYPFSHFAAAKVMGKKEDVEKVYNELSEHPVIGKELMVTLIRWPFDHSYALVHITHGRASKGKVLDVVIDNLYLGERPFIMSSGDDANDIDLIDRGDFKIVMQSAPEYMHCQADFLAPPASSLGILAAWEEGEARYIERCKETV
ncbi:HAD-IIB family hydrolase [Chlamydiifrater phoenicopteri]|uniref:HAD-IIB family hydrolase n=1 Tax=Chlamydiifrater phoenicopteri TaxID=2681469 RepID=UPI001BCC2072|nr:HAD family hydrolase [Chlamydiifrater phoenicopteri]